jgi:16S rRNA processing protein RimM
MARVPASTSTEPREGFVAIGRVLGTWGVRGALKLESLTDFPDRFDPGARLWLGGMERLVESRHTRAGREIVKLTGIDSPEDAESFRGAVIEIPEAELRPLGEDEFYQHDLIGLSVRERSGELLGTVSALLPTGANDVLVVVGPAGEWLLPLIEDVVTFVDLAGGEVRVELLPGIEPRPAKAAKKR